MKTFILFLTVLVLAVSAGAADPDSLIDKNTAFFEGDTDSYVILPPNEFVMNNTEATDDGYSFAFIPMGERYEAASVVIGVNIYRVKEGQEDEFSLPLLIDSDTSAYREHYGAGISIEEVAPFPTETGEVLKTFFFNDSTRFIPNVMLSYLDGGTEVLVFELSISESFPRYKAEKLYAACIARIKILTKGTIGVG